MASRMGPAISPKPVAAGAQSPRRVAGPSSPASQPLRSREVLEAVMARFMVRRGYDGRWVVTDTESKGGVLLT
jgi:hypothetical protein